MCVSTEEIETKSAWGERGGGGESTVININADKKESARCANCIVCWREMNYPFSQGVWEESGLRVDLCLFICQVYVWFFH